MTNQEWQKKLQDIAGKLGTVLPVFRNAVAATQQQKAREQATWSRMV